MKMRFELENGNKDTLVISIEPGGQPTFEARPYVYQPSKAEIEAQEIAEAQSRKQEHCHQLAKTVRMRRGPQGVTQILTAQGDWIAFNFAQPWTDESLVIASRLFWGDYQPGVLESPEANADGVHFVIEKR